VACLERVEEVLCNFQSRCCDQGYFLGGGEEISACGKERNLGGQRQSKDVVEECFVLKSERVEVARLG